MEGVDGSPRSLIVVASAILSYMLSPPDTAYSTKYERNRALSASLLNLA